MNSSLGPFLDSDGITRCKGRLMKSDLRYDAKIILCSYSSQSSHDHNYQGLSRKSYAKWCKGDPSRTSQSLLACEGEAGRQSRDCKLQLVSQAILHNPSLS